MLKFFHKKKSDKKELHQTSDNITKAEYYKQLFQSKLLYFYKNSNKLLAILYYHEETNLTIADLSLLLFQNRSFEGSLIYNRFEYFLETAEFDEVTADNRMECCIYLLDMLYHILDESFQKFMDENVDELTENCYAQRLEFLNVAIVLLQNVQNYCPYRDLFDVRESYFDDENYMDIYQEIKKHSEKLSKPLVNDFVKYVCNNNAIAVNINVIQDFTSKIENFELGLSQKERQKMY